jgi:hypothetical protein
MNRTKPVLPAAIARAMCVRASCDPRSLQKYLAGKPVSLMTLTRIEEALRAGGYGRLVRPPSTQGADES